MATPVPQELNTQPKIPLAYVSGFTFFENPEVQKDMSELTAKELAMIFGCRPKEKARYIHELWRTGRIEVVYDFFMLTPSPKGNTIEIVVGDALPDDQVTEEDVIFNSAIMMKVGKVSNDECHAFLYDLAYASANAHDDQVFGDELLYPKAVEDRVERMMQGVRKLIPVLPA